MSNLCEKCINSLNSQRTFIYICDNCSMPAVRAYLESKNSTMSEDPMKVLQEISRILDNLKYECSAREYTLDEDAMGWIFHCRDLADKALREHKRNQE